MNTTGLDDLASVSVVARLPTLFGPDRGECLPAELCGATIVAIGALAESDLVEGGGFAIDYLTASGDVKRMVFAFNELAMWKVFSGPVCESSTRV